jgi:hypothetical protein
VLKFCSAATFHKGLVNDLWFQKAQPLGQQKVKLHTYDEPSMPTAPVIFQRQLYSTMSDEEPGFARQQSLVELTATVSHKKLWGTLLGEAKKAIEVSITTGRHDGLLAVLAGFASSNIASSFGNVGMNPDVVRGKGRPAGSTNKSKTTHNRPPSRKRPASALVDENPGHVGDGEAHVASAGKQCQTQPHTTGGSQTHPETTQLEKAAGP